jgi:hypothetical protein
MLAVKKRKKSACCGTRDITSLHGILYASHVSSTALPGPGPTSSLTRPTMTALTTHPDKMMRLVKTG